MLPLLFGLSTSRSAACSPARQNQRSKGFAPALIDLGEVRGGGGMSHCADRRGAIDCQSAAGLCRRGGRLDRQRREPCSYLGGDASPRRYAALALWVRSSAEEPLFSCDRISDRFPPFLAHREKASGVLALLFEDARQPVLLLFRPEVIRSVSWVGKPEKLAGPNGSFSLPRRSFDLWIEAKRNHSEVWRPGELDIAADLLATVNFVLVQEARRLRLKQAEQVAQAANRAKIEFLANNRKLAAQNRGLAAAKAATEASNRELEAFSYSVAHDLRSPLRSVDGFCEILEEEYADRLDETGRDYLGRVRRAAQRMGTLIDDLLRLARITQGGLSLSMVNLSHIAAEIRDELQHAAPSGAPSSLSRRTSWPAATRGS